MSDRIIASEIPQVQNIDTFAGYRAVASKLLPWWADATPEQQQQLLLHMRDTCCTDLIHPETYCQSMQTLQQLLAQITPAPEAAAAEQVAKAQAMAEEQEAKLRAEADASLKACVKAFRSGEKAYRAGLLASGKYADQYVHQRMALPNGKRSVAVQAVEGELAKYASSRVYANELIGAYQAHRLLAEEPGVDENVPYGHLRDVWSQLCNREAKDTPQEHWLLLPGFEEDCRKLFAQAAKDGLRMEESEEAVKRLKARYYAAESDKAKRVADQAKAAKAAQDQEAEQKRREALAAQAAAEQAEAKVEDATDDAEKARLAATAEQAKTEQLAKHRAAVDAQAAADARAREQAKADKAAKDKADRQAAEQAKADKAAERKAEKEAAKANGKGTMGTMGTHLLATAKAGTAKDVAAMAAELITGADAPDDVLAELCAVLKASKELSAKGKRAAEAALLVLTRTDKPAATVVPSVNGVVAAVA